MFPMPNLGNIGELFLIQNLKTGIYYIDACFIIMLLVFIHHVDISMYFKKSVDFIWSTNRQSIKQTFVSLTKEICIKYTIKERNMRQVILLQLFI